MGSELLIKNGRVIDPANGIDKQCDVLIVDEKIALIETVKGPWADEWLDNIREIVDPSKIDYIVLNHMEPDHTSALPDIAKIATNIG